MTSEVENIMNGQVVRKIEADKAIGVSTANLMPNEKGEVPLSKQTAFQMESSTIIQPYSSITEKLDLTPSTDIELNEQIPSVNQVPTTSSIINETISDSPVEVVAPTELGGLDINSIIPNIPLVSNEDVSKKIVEETVDDKSAELPKMPETILAEEPSRINDNLFINSQDSSLPVIPSVNEIKEETINGQTLAQDMPLVENSNQTIIENPTAPFVSDVKEELERVDLTQNISPFENATQETLDTPTLSFVDEVQKESTKTDLFQDFSPIGSINQEKHDSPTISTLGVSDELNKNTKEINFELQSKIEDKNEKKLDMILKNVEEINAAINYIKEKIDLNENNVKVQTPMLPQESVPVINNTTSIVEPVIEKQEEMVGALSQIKNMSEFSVDETPIKGGMFI